MFKPFLLSDIFGSSVSFTRTRFSVLLRHDRFLFKFKVVPSFFNLLTFDNMVFLVGEALSGKRCSKVC